MVDAWTDAADVLSVTGVTVTDAQLVQAQADIEVHCNRTFDDTARIRARDLYWLGRAVAYQAAWAKGQYDLATRLNASQVQQDGLIATLNDDGLILSPRAGRALRRVSWMRSRTIHVRSPFVDGQRAAGSALAEANDGQHVWAPMGGDG